MYKDPKRTTGIISPQYFRITHYLLIKSGNDSSISQDQQRVRFSRWQSNYSQAMYIVCSRIYIKFRYNGLGSEHRDVAKSELDK